MESMEPCPSPDQRRVKSDLVWTLLITTFTVACAWLHLQHTFVGINRAHYHFLHTILIIVYPPVPVLLFVFAALCTAYNVTRKAPVDFLQVADIGVRDVLSVTTRDVRFIVWSISNGPTMVSSTKASTGGKEIEVLNVADTPVLVRVGHAIVLLAITVQAAGAVARGVNRVQHAHAMLDIDWHVLWMSLSGLMIAVQTIGLEMVGLRTYIPSRLQRSHTYIMYMLAPLAMVIFVSPPTDIERLVSRPRNFSVRNLLYDSPPAPIPG